MNREWLNQYSEPIIEPNLPIVDPHHHLWASSGYNYLFDDIRTDAESGHRVVATVHVEIRAMYRASGPEALRPLGETDYVNGIAAMSASGNFGIAGLCAGIVGYADLRLGAAVDEVLEGHMRIAGDRFKGLRKIASYDPDPTYNASPYGEDRPGVLLEPEFLEGFACLSRRGLTFDVWLLHTQLDDVGALAGRFPETSIILDHVGTPAGMGSYAGKKDEIFPIWKAAMARLAVHHNVKIKLGGLGMRHHCDAAYSALGRPPGSEELANDWRPYIETCIELFGVSRCMFESNAPVDLDSCSYNVLWNTFKRICSGASSAEKDQLFWKTAADTYRIALDQF